MSRLPTAVPKPPRAPKAARTPIARGKRPNRSNTKRKAAEFARCYHSVERVEFVKRLPCAACGVVGYSQNAHVGKDGKGAGRKAHYTMIAPLCGPRSIPQLDGRLFVWEGCHSLFDAHCLPAFTPEKAQLAADRTHAQWMAYAAGLDELVAPAGPSSTENA